MKKMLVPNGGFKNLKVLIRGGGSSLVDGYIGLPTAVLIKPHDFKTKQSRLPSLASAHSFPDPSKDLNNKPYKRHQYRTVVQLKLKLHTTAHEKNAQRQLG